MWQVRFPLDALPFFPIGMAVTLVIIEYRLFSRVTKCVLKQLQYHTYNSDSRRKSLKVRSHHYFCNNNLIVTNRLLSFPCHMQPPPGRRSLALLDDARLLVACPPGQCPLSASSHIFPLVHTSCSHPSLDIVNVRPHVLVCSKRCIPTSSQSANCWPPASSIVPLFLASNIPTAVIFSCYQRPVL